LMGVRNSWEIDVNMIFVVCFVWSSSYSYFEAEILEKKKITWWLSFVICTG